MKLIIHSNINVISIQTEKLFISSADQKYLYESNIKAKGVIVRE